MDMANLSQPATRIRKPRGAPSASSDHDATNDFVARDVLRHWVATDLKDDE